MTRRGRSLAAAARGCAAVAVIVAVVVGLPVLLYRLGGSPLPRHMPTWQEASAALLRRDSGSVFLAAVRDVSWLGWAAFTVAVAAELQAAVRGRNAPRLRIGGLQSAAAWLVTVAALSFAVQPAAILATAPAAMAATVAPGQPATDHGVAGGPGQAAGHPDAFRASPLGYRLVTVAPGDCLWTIAGRYLGAGERYPEIVALNLGREMGGGQVFRSPSDIWPGWVLRLPAAAHRAPPGGPADPVGAVRSPGRRSGVHEGHPGAGDGLGRTHRAAWVPGPPPRGDARAGSGAAPTAAHGARTATAPAQIPPLAVFGSG
ncbi:MAG: LysM peptidoglycan-binding domain-containing protein, partial [Streptosporangiaceae bacterium]